MTPSDFADLRRRYERLFGAEGVDSKVCDAVESGLALKLPDDLRSIASFYGGGLLGGVSHHAIASRGPAENIVDETLRLRQTAALPRGFVVLAQPPNGLIVLRSEEMKGDAPVIWCADYDVSRLTDLDSLTKPDIWPAYHAFFRHLLEIEEDERGESSA